MNRRLVMFAVCLALAVSAAAQERVSFYVTITGRKQGSLKGESLSAAHRNQIQGLKYLYQVTVPQDSATGMATGRRQRTPVTFTKEWGASSPQLYQAMATNELLNVVFEFVRIGPDGREQVFQRVTLTDAGIVAIKQYINRPEDGAAADPRALEDISLSFRSMEIQNLPGNTTVIDNRAAAP